MSMDGDQLGFDALLSDADQDNAARVLERETAHLPSDLDAAIAYHRKQIEDHHTAMLACDFKTALAIRRDAKLLARKLNNGDPGILAHGDAPGNVLVRACSAPEGSIPRWGQDGRFTIELHDIAIDVKMHGMFGIAASSMPYLGFEIRAVDKSKPFLSNTGYRSFLGCSVESEVGLTVEAFVKRLLAHYIETDLRGKLIAISMKIR